MDTNWLQQEKIIEKRQPRCLWTLLCAVPGFNRFGKAGFGGVLYALFQNVFGGND